MNRLLLTLALAAVMSCSIQTKEESSRSPDKIDFKDIKIETEKFTVAPGETITLKALGIPKNKKLDPVLICPGWGTDIGSYDNPYESVVHLTIPTDVQGKKEVQIWIGGGEAGDLKDELTLAIE